MKCPNCGQARLMTKQVMQSDDKTCRYKRCPACSWNFTSVEEIPDNPPVIPNSVRRGLVK